MSLYFMFSRGLCCKTAKTARECSMSSRGGYGRWPAIHLCSEGQTIPWKSTGRCLVSPGGRMGAPEQSAVEAAMAFRMPRRRFPCQWAWWPSGLPLVGSDVPAWRLNWRTSRVQQEHDGEPLGPGGGASRQRGAVVPGLRSTLGRCPSNCKPSKSPALCSWRGPRCPMSSPSSARSFSSLSSRVPHQPLPPAARQRQQQHHLPQHHRICHRCPWPGLTQNPAHSDVPIFPLTDTGPCLTRKPARQHKGTPRPYSV